MKTYRKLLVLTAALLLVLSACASASAGGPKAVSAADKPVALDMKRSQIKKIFSESMAMDLEGGFLMCEYGRGDADFVVLYDPDGKAVRLRCFDGVTAYNGIAKGMSRDEALSKCPQWAVKESDDVTRVDFDKDGKQPGEVAFSMSIHFEGDAVSFFVVEYPEA